MPLLVVALAVVIPLAIIALLPVLLIQRYRVASARRQARPWLATANVLALVISVVFFLIGAATTSVWVPAAFWTALAGLGVGLTLGVAGLLATRWEATPASLHYTPNKWLVLAVTLIVTARLVYGFWNGWMTLRAGGDASSWLSAFGVAGSLGAGATVLGYYLAYGLGLRRRIRVWQRRALRRM